MQGTQYAPRRSILCRGAFCGSTGHLGVLRCKAALTAGLYLRNLPTHTVNSLLQKLNYVKRIQYYTVKQKFNIIHIMCENFRTIPLVLCKIQIF